MAADEGRYTFIDRNISANLRIYREAGNISQEELAQRMTDRGFGFSQATIWKIENGQRPVKASELVALADSLEVMSLASFMAEPGDALHDVQVDQAHRRAYGAFEALKEAAAVYIEAQLNLAYAVHLADNAGVAVREMHTVWLNTLAEQAVIEARIEMNKADAHGQQISDEVYKVMDALRTTGYEPTLRVEDDEISDGGPLPSRTPAQPDDTPDT
jgi:transcriptional regulator with XRE-family HTH domain